MATSDPVPPPPPLPPGGQPFGAAALGSQPAPPDPQNATGQQNATGSVLTAPDPRPTTSAAPTPAPRPEDTRPLLERVGLRRFGLPVVGLLTLAALLGDLGLRASLTNVASLLAVAALGSALAVLGVSRSPRGVALLAAVGAVAIWLPIRSHWTLATLNTLTLMGLFAAAALLHNVHAVRCSAELVGALIVRAFTACLGPFVVLASLTPLRTVMESDRTMAERTSRSLPIVRGVILAVIPLLVLGALLASSDAVFASLFTFDVDLTLGPLVEHLFLIGFLGAGASVLAAATVQIRPEGDVAPTRLVGKIEATVVLALVGALFSIFAVVQIVTALGGARHILETEGLTRADYARDGFFQLLAVAAITLVLVIGLRSLARGSTDKVEQALRGASSFVCLLTIGIVAVSLSRLWLYIDAFGMTELRLLSTAFAIMLGVIFALLAVSSAFGGQHQWFWWASTATAILVLVALNAMNYEARILEWNLTQERSGEIVLERGDIEGLSPDAIPTLFELAPERVAGLSQICALTNEQVPYGPLGFNLGRHRASPIIEQTFGELC